MKTPELKPCPFCGGPAETNDGGDSVYGRFWWAVGCSSCDVVFCDREKWDGNGHLTLPPQECFERWNRRAPVCLPEPINT